MKKKKRDYKHKALRRALEKEGITVIAAFGSTPATDAGVELEDDVDVQMNGGKFHVSQWNEGEQALIPLGTFDTVEELVQHLNSAACNKGGSHG